MGSDLAGAGQASLRRGIYKLGHVLLLLLITQLPGLACGPGCGRTPWVGDKASDFQLRDPLGHTRTLQDYLGKWTVINFWMGNCEPCRISMPKLDRAFRRHRERGAMIVGINSQEDLPTVVDFCRKKEITYPVLLDPDARVQKAYMVQSVPSSFFLDPSGTIVEIMEEAATEVDVRRHLARALSGGL